MAKKKKKRYPVTHDEGGLVYSTDPEVMRRITNPPPASQTVEAHFSKKGRGGKTAVVIKGVQGDDQTLKALAKKIKTALATGGSVKDGEIIIQGDVRDKVVEILQREGYKVKKVGG
ncbi:MAG: translation initiation factor [Chlorobi bacterium]|nr:translation initiation factor [Chlorobiota bacterium]